MEAPFSMNDLAYAENFLAQDDAQTALPLLLDLRDAAEAFIDSSCTPAEDTQYFSFGSTFERLAYRRVEDDPRTLVNVSVPLDRLYADLSFAYVRLNEYTLARDALMQAVRWNPMRCAYRLDLAELFRHLGDTKEWASLSHSVIERASDPTAGGRAYANLGQFFLDEDNLAAAVAMVLSDCGFSVGILWPGSFSIASRTLARGGTLLFALLALGGDVGCSLGPTFVGMISSNAQGSLHMGILAAVIFPALMLTGCLVLPLMLMKKREAVKA